MTKYNGIGYVAKAVKPVAFISKGQLLHQSFSLTYDDCLARLGRSYTEEDIKTYFEIVPLFEATEI